MKLKDYFDTHPINKADFARMSGISLRTLFNALEEKTDIALSIAIAIHEMSGGKVKCQDLLSEKFRRVGINKKTSRERS